MHPFNVLAPHCCVGGMGGHCNAPPSHGADPALMCDVDTTIPQTGGSGLSAPHSFSCVHCGIGLRVMGVQWEGGGMDLKKGGGA